MRLGIQLGESSNYSIELSEEQATGIYIELMQLLLNRWSASQVATMPDELETSLSIIKEAMAALRDTPEEEEIVETEVDASPEEVVILNPFKDKEKFMFEKLVAYQCPDCGKITVRFMTLGVSNVTHCHFCRVENITIKSVIMASYRCEECKTSAYAWMANGLQEIPCKNCEAPIDLFIDKKDYMLKSSNLVDKKYQGKH